MTAPFPVKHVDRSAAFTFCPNGPFLAAGSVAGAIDLSFSTSSQLEIFALDFASDDSELKLAGGAVQAPERFARLAWSAAHPDSATFSYGLLAGGLADGSVCLWNPTRIIGCPASNGKGNSMLSRLQRHQGAVRGIEFNPFSSNLLASGAMDGELCIWDVQNPAQPSLYPAMKGSAASGPGNEITVLSWNRKVQHILTTATTGGTVVVWDLKKQRPAISFKDPGGRRRCSAVAWNPEVATQLVVASDDDSSPALQLWDLRNSVSPLRELHAHSKGVLSLSWCPQDPRLLLSSAKDALTVVWDVPTATAISQLPPAATGNWQFDVQWAPGKSAGVFAGATFEGQISIQTLGKCLPASTIHTSPHSTKATATAAESVPPAWLKRPAGVTFGFGGKLARFGPGLSPGTIVIDQVSVTDARSAIDLPTELKQVIKTADKEALRALCQSRVEELSGTDPSSAETWSFLQSHFESDGRTHLLQSLGFGEALPKPSVEEAPKKAPNDGSPPAVDHGWEIKNETTLLNHNETLAQSWGTDGAAFFDDLSSPNDLINAENSEKQSSNQPTASLGDGRNTKGSNDNEEDDDDNVRDGVPGDGERSICDALLVGNLVGAVEACMDVKRHADALLIASMVGGECYGKARTAYMKAHPRPFMRVLHATLSGKWETFVSSRPTSAWKETLAALLTSAPYDKFPALVSRLASGLCGAGAFHEATLCYVCSGDVESAVRLWSRSAGDSPQAQTSALEKAVILGMGVEGSSGNPSASSALGDLLARRAEALAANGRMEAAFEILSLVPGDTSEGAAVLKDRLLYSGAVGSDANKAYSSTTATAAYGQSTGQVSSVGQAQPIQTVYSTYGSTYGNGQQYSYPYNANGGQLGSPSAWQAPTTYQPMQPPVGSAAPPPPPPPPSAPPTTFQPMQPTTNASVPPPPAHPPPPSAPPTTFQPMQPTTNAPPPPMAIQASIASAGSAPSTAPIAPPPPPTVYQPAARSGSGVASPGSDNYYAQHQQHQMQSQSQPQSQPAQAFQTYSPVTAPAPAPGISSPRYGLGQQQRLHPQAQPNQAIPSPSPSPHPPSPKPQGPPADVTLLTADTSAVPADLKSVVSSFIGLYQKCEAVVGANVAKRRELDDASRKLGGLVWRMNQGQVSGGVASKLQALCAALDAGEYVAAGHVQVQLTTSHWDECASWLTALKRLIKMRQMAG